MWPTNFRKNLPIYIVATYIFFIGLSYIFSITLGLHNHKIVRTVGSPIQSVLLGVGLIYLSGRLLKRLFRAWLITTTLVVGALVREFIILPRSLDLTNTVLLLIAASSLWLLRHQFKAQSEKVQLKSSLALSAILLGIALVYGTIGFSRIPQPTSGHHFTAKEGLVQTVKVFMLSETSPNRSLSSKRSEAFLLSLRALGLASIVLAGYSLLQPLIYRQEHNQESKERAKTLLQHYGGNSEDYFKLWPDDKSYIFSDNGEAAIAYKIRSGIALVAGDPFGRPSSLDDVTKKFLDFCSVHGFGVAFVHTTNQYQKLYTKYGLVMQKIGEEAIVDLTTFASNTIQSKKWRHVMNKFDKLGYECELRKPPHSQTLLDELERISDDWLKTPGRSERGFVMGYFDRTYLNSCTLAIVRNDEKQIAGFVNLVHSFDASEANMDLFRQRSGSPTNMTDYMIARILLAAHTDGFDQFNVGLCPLVGMDDEDANGPISKALSLVYSFGGKFYSFKGLHQFKSKFDPTWRDRYIALQPGAFGIMKVAQALRQAMKVEYEPKAKL